MDDQVMKQANLNAKLSPKKFRKASVQLDPDSDEDRYVKQFKELKK